MLSKLIFAVMLAATGAQAGTQVSVSNCVSDVLHVQGMGFAPDVIETRAMTIQIRNAGQAQLSGTYIEWELWSDARPAPLDAGYFRDATTLDAGLMPGEVVQVVDYHFMDAHAIEAARTAKTLTLKLEVRSVTTSTGDRLDCP